MLTFTSCLTACLITRSTENLVSPVTAPRIQDVQGITSPRLGALLVLQQGTGPTQVDFRVPVDDDGVDKSLEYQFFVNANRDCVPITGTSCEPDLRPEVVPADGNVRRMVTRTITIPQTGCNRVELYVTSSQLLLSGNYRTPSVPGDIAFETWWVFVVARGSTAGSGDAGVFDPLQQCAYLVQP